ncbi:MAG: hypothetical protein WAT51_15590 [Holophaga sp.]
MTKTQLRSNWGSRQATLFMLFCLLVAVALGILAGEFGTIRDFEPNGIATASRTLNQFMAVAATSIALIIPLTANLYTPRLVKLYVTHPLIVVGLLIFVVGHSLTMCMHLFPKDHALRQVLIYAIAAVYLIVLAGALPYLYGISQFLRPSFFMPMLTRKGVRNLEDLNKGKRPQQNVHDLFENIDVVTNMALTGMGRGDRQLVLLALESLNALLTEIIGSGEYGTYAWRSGRPFFVPGLAHEGQNFLIREKVWPEAYVLAQTLKVMEGATKRQHEITAEVAGQMVDTARLASIMQRDRVVELHIMAFNTLMREAIEEKDLRRFQNLSYHYRLLIEAFHDTPARMHEAAQHLVHYGKISVRQGLYFGLETVVYDMGELVLSLGKHDQERAVELVQAWAGPLWQESIDQTSTMKKVGWRTLIRVYWEAKALDLEELANSVYWRYLSDEAIHREQVELILDENRELHFEFNDRLMRFAHLSPAAEEKAREFLESW